MRKAQDMTREHPDLSVETMAPFERVGHLLRNRREELHISLQELESSTSIRAPYLQALEDGQVDKLISPVYAQGFLRKYATSLQLEEHPLILEAFDWLQGKQQAASPSITDRDTAGPSLTTFLSSLFSSGSSPPHPFYYCSGGLSKYGSLGSRYKKNGRNLFEGDRLFTPDGNR